MIRRRLPVKAVTSLALTLSVHAVSLTGPLLASAAFGWTPKATPSGTRRANVRLHAASTPMELWLDARRDVIGGSTIVPSRSTEADAIIVGPDDSSLPSATDGSAYKVYELRSDEQKPLLPPMLCSDGASVGALVDVSDPSGQDTALGLVGSVEWVLITCDAKSTKGSGGVNSSEDDDDEDDGDKQWLMIPAENLISACQATGTKVAALVRRAGDVGGLSRALELGVDALCVEATADEELWDAALEARQERFRNSMAGGAAAAGDDEPTRPSLVRGTCRRLQSPGGKSTVLADRVCIDLVQCLKSTEGCWVGSSAKLTALVLSEAAESTYVPSRPFRVNAGPVHSYVVMGDGQSTKYLSELRAGDEVLVYDVETGKERSVAVGRLKVEVRPCVIVGLCIEGDSSDGRGEGYHRVDGQVFLQQAETVRLGQRLGEGSFVRVTDLVADGSGDDILLRVVSMGTHVGKAYSGKVTEQ